MRTITAVGPLLFSFAMWISPSVAPAQDRADHDRLIPSITVSGRGEVRVRPDIAQINVGVVTQSESAAEALRQNNEAMKKLLALLKQRGIAEKDIQTIDFSVTPQRQYDRQQPMPPKIVGYQVTNQVRVIVRQLDSLGAILDAVVQEGANQINGIGFDVDNPERILDDARREAIRDAKRKAELYAEAVNGRLGPVLRIQEQAREPVPQPMYTRMAMATESAVPIASGQQTLEASVSVTYRLLTGGDPNREQNDDR